MVWYGMIWYGMVWYGMVWYGMVWYGMVWYGMVPSQISVTLLLHGAKNDTLIFNFQRFPARTKICVIRKKTSRFEFFAYC